MDSFSKSLEELLSFADSLKLREKELEQQHKLELEKQKSEYEIELKMEKKRVEQLQEINRGLTQQVELASQTQIAMEQKYTVSPGLAARTPGRSRDVPVGSANEIQLLPGGVQTDQRAAQREETARRRAGEDRADSHERQDQAG